MKESIKSDGNEHEVAVMVLEFEQDNLKILYSPSLKVCSYGETTASARKNFDSAIEAFFEFENKKSRLHDTLIGLGWAAEGKKSNTNLSPPKEHELNIPYHIFAQANMAKEVVSSTRPVRVPAFA